MKSGLSSRSIWTLGIVSALSIVAVTALVWLTFFQRGPTLEACADGACPVTLENLNTLSPDSPEASSIAGLWWGIFGVAVVVFVLVEGALLWTVLRFRNRKPEEAVQIHGNTKLELAWTAAPALILVVVMGFSFRAMADIRAPASENFITVNVVAQQFWWAFTYPEFAGEDGRALVTGSELVVPVDTVINVRLESRDVEHGFWVPELFGKMDAVPGYLNQLRFTPQKVGTFYAGQCTQLCGTQHAQMRFIVRVVSREEFDDWVAQQLAPPPAVAAGSAAARGQAAYLAAENGCVACHVIDTVGGVGVIGPNLTNVGNRSILAGGIIANTPENMAAWLRNPQLVKPGSRMVLPRELDEATISDLVAYLGTLR